MQIRPIQEAPRQCLEILYSTRYYLNKSFDDYIRMFRLVLIDDDLFFGDTKGIELNLRRFSGYSTESLYWYYSADAIIKNGKVLKNLYGYVTD